MGRRAQRTSSEELHHIILGPTKGKYYRPTEPCDEVYPGIFIGDSSAALSTCLLKELKITHVLNAAHGKNDRYNYGYVNTSFANYMQAGIKFMGIHAQDTPSCYLRPYFQQAADFIEESLKSGGKVLSHCLCGISRSSTLVAAYLMIKKGMSVEEAISTLRARRSIYPNNGFLSQLSDLDFELRSKKESDSNAVGSALKRKDNQDLEIVTLPDNQEGEMPIKGYNFNKEVTRGGYPLTSFYYDIATKSRSRPRGTDRNATGYYEYRRARSASPSPSYYQRESSVLPDVELSSYRPRATSVAPRARYIEPSYGTVPALSNYESGIGSSQRIYYHTRNNREPFVYSGRMYSRPITTTYLRSMYPSSLGVTGSFSRSSNSSVAPSPYESISVSTPYINRTYSNYTRFDGTPSRFNRGVSSAIKYPALYPETYRQSYRTPLKVY